MTNNRNRNRSKKRPVEDNYIPPFAANALAEPIETLGLRDETLELLKGAEIITVLELVKRTDADFYRIMRFNKKNLLDVKFRLNDKKMFLRPAPEPKPAPQNPEGAADRSIGTAESEARDNRPRGERNGEPRQTNRDRNANAVRNEGNPRQNQNGGRQNPRGNVRDGRGGERRDEVRNGANARGKTGQGERFDDISEKKTKALREKNRPPKTMPETVQDAYVKVNKGGKWGFSDRRGTIVVEPVYDEVYTYKEDLCCVEREERAGFIDRAGEVVIEPQYECASSFSEGCACVFKGGKCGYIDRDNNVVVDFLYDAGTAFQNGSCRVKKDEKWGELSFEETEDGIKKTVVRWII